MPHPPSRRKERAPKLPRFSPTRISLYLSCPRAYHFYYREGLRWGSISAGHAFGGSLHRTLQQFHERGGAGAVSEEELIREMQERWTHAGYASAEEAAEHLAGGEALLREYYRRPSEPGRETLWTERTLQQAYPKFVLFGKIDRLDRRADGVLEVVDYKSGRRSVTEEQVRNDLALRIYQLLVARENPGIPIRTGIYCLRTGVSASVLRSAAELDEVEAEIALVVETILQDEAMQPVPGLACRDCAYPRICPPGRNWLAQWKREEAERPDT